MMAFNPFPQMATSLKVEDAASNTEALRLLASSNFLTGGPPLPMPQVPVDAVRAMLPNGFPFPLMYPGLPQDFKPEFLTAGGGPMPLFMEQFGFHHPYAGLDGSRRKNATRETTAPLKEWLNSHRTNPYPTKQEKILLAVMTKMTLTQVSTWFANARRRLKKENGGNCSIKRAEGEDDDDDMGELDRPSSSASNISCGSNIKEEAEEDKDHSVDIKLDSTPVRDNLTPKKKMLLIENILGVKDDKKPDDEVSGSKKDSPSSEESGPIAAARHFAAFQQMMAMYTQNPQQLLAAQLAQQTGRTAFFPFPNFPMMSMAAAAVPTTPTGAGANGSFTSEATSASPSSCHSTAPSKESSPQPKSPKIVKSEA